MDKHLKNSLLMAGSALAGGYGGSWAAQRICTALGCNLGPWGSAIGAVLGAMASTALTKSIIGEPDPFADFDEAMDAGETVVEDVMDSAEDLTNEI